VLLSATGTLGEGVSCSVHTGRELAATGLLERLTERYCVVYQTLVGGAEVQTTFARAGEGVGP
jgi:hypothetical protein